mmetsp:Transcript_70839/g.171406  ORF Transcript_70839/g.171406 Transcript_70839/m.171406 type:complete len:271 (+) Transcript_70839:1775-2587(+)
MARQIRRDGGKLRVEAEDGHVTEDRPGLQLVQSLVVLHEPRQALPQQVHAAVVRLELVHDDLAGEEDAALEVLRQEVQERGPAARLFEDVDIPDVAHWRLVGLHTVLHEKIPEETPHRLTVPLERPQQQGPVEHAHLADRVREDRGGPRRRHAQEPKLAVATWWHVEACLQRAAVLRQCINLQTVGCVRLRVPPFMADHPPGNLHHDSPPNEDVQLVTCGPLLQDLLLGKEDPGHKDSVQALHDSVGQPAEELDPREQCACAMEICRLVL